MPVAGRSRLTSHRPRRTQAERTAATRARLLDATIDCLIEVGYARTTTTLIADRAGLSRGAQVHHFPSKADLVADAVDHLARRRVEEAGKEAAQLGEGRDRVRTTLDLIWAGQADDLFKASLELWVAARADAELAERLAPVDAELRQVLLTSAAEAFGPDVAAHEDFDRIVLMALATAQGLTLMGEHGTLDTEELWAFARERLAALFEQTKETEAR